LWKITASTLPKKIFLPAVNGPQSICQTSSELIGNGGFETGKNIWTEAGVDVIINRSYSTLPVTPYAGDWLAWFGGRNNVTDTIYQNFTVPNGLTGASLGYRLYMSTDETGGVYDHLYVRLRTSSGELIQTLDSLSNTYSPAGQWTARSVNVPALTSYQGQSLRISFEATTDNNLVSNFFVDNVTITPTY
jgi:hypothetical protein